MKIQIVFRSKGMELIVDSGLQRVFMICSYLPGDWVLPQIKRESATIGVNFARYLFIAAFCFAYERFTPRTRAIARINPETGRVEDL